MNWTNYKSSGFGRNLYLQHSAPLLPVVWNHDEICFGSIEARGCEGASEKTNMYIAKFTPQENWMLQ